MGKFVLSLLMFWLSGSDVDTTLLVFSKIGSTCVTAFMTLIE